MLVTRSGSHAISDHFDSSRELEVHLAEQEKQSYLEKVRANYLRIAKEESRIRIIDAKQPAEKVLADILVIIEEKF